MIEDGLDGQMDGGKRNFLYFLSTFHERILKWLHLLFVGNTTFLQFCIRIMVYKSRKIMMASDRIHHLDYFFLKCKI